MIRAGSVAAVFRFEIRRTLTFRRMAWWIALVGFPILLSLSARLEFEEPPRYSRMDILEVGGSGEITLNDGQQVLTEPASTEYILTKSPGWRPAPEQFEQPSFEGKGGRDGKGRRPRRRRRERRHWFLVLQVPGDMPTEDQQDAVRARLEPSFQAVFFQPANSGSFDITTALDERAKADGTGSEDAEGPSEERVIWALSLFLLLPVVVAMLGVLLWATPAIASELEGRKWAYIATRPDGPVNVLIGKYLVGVAWGLSAALVSLAGCLSVANVEGGSWSLFPTLATLIVLGCPAYGAVYALIGAIKPRRAMVIAVVYSVIFEGLISFLPVMLGDPALISRITVSYPLRALLTKWVGLDKLADEDIARFAVSNSLDWVDIGSIIGITVLALTAAVLILRSQELSQADESDS